MKKGGLLEEIRTFVMNMGYRLLDLRETRHRSDRVIRFAIYRPEGISVGDCARVTLAVRDFVFMLENDDDIRVEVSSPGAERVFRGPDDYEVFVDRKVQLTLKSGRVERWWYRGLDEEGQVLFSEKPDSADMIKVLMVDIGKCRLVLE